MNAKLLPKQTLIAILICIAILALSPSFASADPPAVGGKPVWYVSDRGISPRTLKVGETYTLWITANNDSGNPILTRATITSTPDGDELLSDSTKEVWVGAGSSYTFKFSFRRGSGVAGTVYYNIEPIKAK